MRSEDTENLVRMIRRCKTWRMLQLEDPTHNYSEM